MALMWEQVPDPAPAMGAGSDKEPLPLHDVVEEFKAKEPGASMVVDTEDHLDRDITHLDRDELVFMLAVQGKDESGGNTKANDASKSKAPASFMHRQAYVRLHEKSLTKLPPLAAAGVFYHNSTRQWHTQWDGGNRAPTWGPGLRTEKQALLLALLALWRKYLEWNSSDENAKEHVAKLLKEMEEPED